MTYEEEMIERLKQRLTDEQVMKVLYEVEYGEREPRPGHIVNPIFLKELEDHALVMAMLESRT